MKYLKKSPKQPSTDDVKTREIVQKLLNELEKYDNDFLKIYNKAKNNDFIRFLLLDLSNKYKINIRLGNAHIP